MYKKIFTCLVIATSYGSVSAQEIRPSINRVAQLPFSDRIAIDIHRSAQGTAEDRKNLYFHKPAFFLFQAQQNAPHHNEGWPKYVHDVRSAGSADETLIVVKIVSSSARIRELARDQILLPAPEGDAAWIDTHELEPHSIGVLQWPVTKVRMSIATKDAPDFSKASGETPLTESQKSSGVWELRLIAPTGQIEGIKNAMNQGEALFRFDYQYIGLKESEGKASRSYTLEATSTVNDTLNSEQRSGNAPIFQSEKQELISKISESTVTVISATDAELINHLSINWENTLFSKSAFLSELDPSPKLLSSVDSYLKQLVDTITTSKEEFDKTTKTNETNTTLRMKTEGGWKTGWEASGEIELTKEWKRKAEREYGVTLKETNVKNVVVASDIRVSFLADSWRQGIQKASTYAFISSPTQSGFEFAAIIEGTRVTDDAGNAKAKPIKGTRVPLGGAICYFGSGDQPPNGFAFLRKGFQWPNAPWVHKNLRGQVAESFEGHLVGATEENGDVGRVWRKGAATIPSASIPGSAFSANGPRLLGTTTTQVSHDKGGGQYDGPFRRPGSQSSVFRNQYWQRDPHPTREIPFAGVKFMKIGDIYRQTSPNADDPYSAMTNILAKPLVYNAPSSLTGSHVIEEKQIALNTPSTMPNHVKCRWIVRTE